MTSIITKRGTTIDEINVPAKLRERYSFHDKHNKRLMFLTNLYGGEGLTPSTVTLLTGTPGSGKSTLLLQMAHALHSRGDCFVLFNGCEESMYQTRLVCERLFKSDVPKFYIGDDTIVDSVNDDMHAKNKSLAAMGKLRSSIGHMRMLMKKHPNLQPVLMFDSLQMLDDGKYADGHVNGQSAVRALALINRFCKATFASSVIIGQVTKEGEAAGANKLIHNVDIYMHMYIDEDGKSDTKGLRLITTKKNRYGFSGLTHILRMWDDGLYEDGAKY